MSGYGQLQHTDISTARISCEVNKFSYSTAQINPSVLAYEELRKAYGTQDIAIILNAI